jgi:hypothetical protein
MNVGHALPLCDECRKQVVQSFHAILGGKIYRLCSEPCRRRCRVRHAPDRGHLTRPLLPASGA